MISLLLPVLLATSFSAQALSKDEEKTALESIRKDREETRAYLKSDPDSYLAAIKRVSFKGKELTLGAAEGNDIVLKDGGLLPRHLRLAVAGEKFTVKAVDAGASFTLGKSTQSQREAESAPGRVVLGRYALRLSHQGYPAVIVFDSKSPRFKEYKGIEYFPPDLSYRFVVPFLPDPSAASEKIESTASAERPAVRLGWFVFNVKGKPVRLAAHRLLEPGSSPDSMNLFFRDATTGKESYKVGRYLTPEKQPDGSYVLDFNMAYLPACAYSSFYNCPIPPAENRLKVAIRAGEKNSSYKTKQ